MVVVLLSLVLSQLCYVISYNVCIQSICLSLVIYVVFVVWVELFFFVNYFVL